MEIRKNDIERRERYTEIMILKCETLSVILQILHQAWLSKKDTIFQSVANIFPSFPGFATLVFYLKNGYIE